MMKSITLFLFSSLLGMGLILFYFRGYIFPSSISLNREPQLASQTSQFSLEKAPSQSRAGNILSLSGSVFWQSRIATEPARLTASVAIQQGEKIMTYDNGNITIGFGNSLLVTVSPKTELDLIQTLPTNFVLWQDQGSATYTKTDTTPLAVRSLNLLTQIASGSANISVDKKDAIVIVKVNTGSVTVSYNNLKYVSQVETILAGKRLIFDDEKRTTQIKPLAE